MGKVVTSLLFTRHFWEHYPVSVSAFFDLSANTAQWRQRLGMFTDRDDDIICGCFVIPQNWDSTANLQFWYNRPNTPRAYRIGARAISSGTTPNATISYSDTVTAPAISDDVFRTVKYTSAAFSIQNSPTDGDLVLLKVQRTDQDSDDTNGLMVKVELGTT